MPSTNPLEKNKATQATINSPRQQKMAVGFLASGAILIIVLWVFQFSAQLNKPLSTDKKLSKTATSTDIDLTLRDSDGDGISDYEEINIYKTSPYLEDSDSDNINDKQEISEGTDPNCPKGKICNTVESSPAPIASSTIIQEEEFPVVSGEAAIVPNIGSEVTPATLRQLLLQNGYDAATLDKISDEDIMKSYQEAIKSQSGSGVDNPGSTNQ